MASGQQLLTCRIAFRVMLSTTMTIEMAALPDTDTCHRPAVETNINLGTLTNINARTLLVAITTTISG